MVCCVLYLEDYLYDAGHNGQFEELDCGKDFNPLVKQFLDVTQQTAVHSTTTYNNTERQEQ